MQFLEVPNEQSGLCFWKDDDKLVFDPPVYERRYAMAAEILALQKFGNRIRNIVEFGCAEMKFFTFMKNGVKQAEIIDLVDIDGDLLERFKNRITPLITEYVRKRETKLTARIWQGSVSAANPNFQDVDAVVAIELIEHVYPDVLNEIPFVIFGVHKPKIAIITTPNEEFNVLFHLESGKFRHDDHKFEWTRSEFQDWCDHICIRFPDYRVQFHGVGKGPAGFEQLGSCSQMGFFIRKDFLESLNDPHDVTNVEKPTRELIACDDYKLIHSIEYPFFYDKRDRNEKITDEVDYHMNRLRWIEEQYFNYETDRTEIPLGIVANLCWEYTDDIEEVRKIVEAKFPTDGDLIILPPNEMSSEEEELGESEN